MPLPHRLIAGSPSPSDHDAKPSGGPARCAGLQSSVLDRAIWSSDGGPDAPSAALVVFADHTSCAWLRFLRRGFRHCFIVLRAGPLWLACEPLKDRLELNVLALPVEFDLAAFYGAQGHHVLQGGRLPPRPQRSFAPAPLTCVTVVKRLLGIRAPWVWTPWQLYVHLTAPRLGFRPWAGLAGPERDESSNPRAAGQA